MAAPKKTAANRAAARASLATKKPKDFDKPVRAKGGQFVKGSSGNPGGLRNGVKAHAYRIQRETDNGNELVDFLIDVLRNNFDAEGLNAGMLDDTTKFKARQWALEKLYERGFGRPKETVEIISSFDDGGDATMIPMSEMSEAELAALTAAGDILEKHAAKKEPIDV